jgi:predicted ATPase
MLCQMCRARARAGEYAEACGAVAAEHGLLFWRAGSAVMTGWALAAAGVFDEGINRLREGLQAWRQTGSGTYQTYFLGLLADVLAQAGRSAEARPVLDEALDLARQTGEGLYEAELYRLRGEALLCETSAPNAEVLQRAEQDFRRALDVSRRQTAKSLGLRAAMSLFRLSRHMHQFGETRELLAATCEQFTEGLDMPDLREAHDLLHRNA